MVDLERTYGAGARAVAALAGINLTVQRGSFVALMGLSGSGKTTLLNCIGGLDRPTGGEVTVLGQPLGRLNERGRTRLRRRSMGFVFQSFALLPTYSAAENIDVMLRLGGVGWRARRARIAACLDRSTGPDTRSIARLSCPGGQQRVAIARALALQPSLLLADEPTGELDSATGEQILALFRRLVEEEDLTVIMATHNPAVMTFASELHQLRDGRLV